ncbi:hypothetical protein W01_21970 [Candidatus Nitrotoga sp. AM1P]|nr:hypothetical protein W01_21970 [Candidatus Nitrotoga sp. AM1P]
MHATKIKDRHDAQHKQSLKPPRNMKLLPWPPYAPYLNSVEHVWDKSRKKYTHNKID